MRLLLTGRYSHVQSDVRTGSRVVPAPGLPARHSDRNDAHQQDISLELELAKHVLRSYCAFCWSETQNVLGTSSGACLQVRQQLYRLVYGRPGLRHAHLASHELRPHSQQVGRLLLQRLLSVRVTRLRHTATT